LLNGTPLSGASFNLVDRHFEASILRAFRGVRLRHITFYAKYFRFIHRTRRKIPTLALSAKPFWRGQAASLHRITEAVIVPVLIDRARRGS